MGFLDTDFDLNGTPFTQQDLQIARNYWQFLIENVAPEWSENPRGSLGVHWRSNTIPSTVMLIDTARMVHALARSITKESQPILGSKLRQLLYSHGVQNDEQITELIAGALLELGKPIIMEPISTASPSGNATPPTVDYCVEWDNAGGIYFESTVFHIKRLVEWESATEALKRRFQNAMIRDNLNRSLRILAPLELTNKTLSPKEIDKSLRVVAGTPEGRHSVRLQKDHLVLEWSSVPHLGALPDTGLEGIPGFAVIVGEVEVAMVAATHIQLKWPGDAEELVIKSLRNTLNGKRRQFSLEAPYLLFLRILSGYIPVEGVLDLLHRRVYNNALYRWISAVAVLKVSSAVNTAYRPHVTLVLNPNAKYPLPKSFVDTVFSGSSRRNSG